MADGRWVRCEFYGYVPDGWAPPQGYGFTEDIARAAFHAGIVYVDALTLTDFEKGFERARATQSEAEVS